MKVAKFPRWLPLALCGALSWTACSDSEGSEQLRTAYLDRGPAAIAADALSATPSAEFVAVRTKVASKVTKERRDYARRIGVGPGSAAALVADATISDARNKTAVAVGAKLDAGKVTNVALAQASLDTLLIEIQNRVAGATSCDALGEKADDCVFALLLLEVKRSEFTTMLLDAGLPPLDSGAVSDGGTRADGALSDGSISGPLTGIQCGPRDLTGAREVMGYLDVDTTWSDKIWVKGSVYVRGGTLTIQPGTQIFMEVDSSLEIGWNSSAAAINAQGTEAAPIRICGKVAERGYWGSLIVGSNVTSDSVLRNVLIADGAGNGEAALQLEADVTVDNVQLRNVQHSGVLASDFKAGSRLLSVEGSGGAAVALTGIGALTRFPLGGSFLDNVDNVARVRLTYVDGDTVVHNIGIPYLQETDVYTRMGALTFEPGVDYRFPPDTMLEVGWNSSSAGLHVNGTAAAPVIFRGVGDTSTNWQGIRVNTNVLTDSNISYAEIRQAGGTSDFALDVDSPIKLDHVTLRQNAKGLALSAKGLAPSSTALTITATQSYPIVVQTDGIYSLPAGSALTGNTIDQIRVEGTYFDASGTIAPRGVPYLLANSMYVRGGVMMTIAAGTSFLMSADVDLDIGWNSGDVTIIANGTAEAPIRFTGLSESAGFWGTITLGPNVRTSSLFNYVQIGHGGQSAGALLDLQANVPVTNSRFFASGGSGITKDADNTIDYTLTNTFENTPAGNVVVP